MEGGVDRRPHRAEGLHLLPILWQCLRVYQSKRKTHPVYIRSAFPLLGAQGAAVSRQPATLASKSWVRDQHRHLQDNINIAHGAISR